MSGAAARTGGVNEKKNNNIYKIACRYANKKRQISYRGETNEMIIDIVVIRNIV